MRRNANARYRDVDSICGQRINLSIVGEAVRVNIQKRPQQRR